MAFKCEVIFTFCVFIAATFAEKCKTPNNEIAECISLYSCTTLLNALKKQTPEAADFVRNSNCGGTPADPKVCCGSDTGLKVKLKQEKDLLADRQYCGYQHTDDYVHKNIRTNIDEFPWLAAINGIDDDNNTRTICGGSLINIRYILTCAHCMFSRMYRIVGVQLGDYHAKNISDCVTNDGFMECSKVEKFGIEEQTIHPSYDRLKSLNNIALLRLDRNIQYSDYIRPICLPIPGGVSAKPGDILKISGFGLANFNSDVVEIKKKVSTKLITYEECIKSYEKDRRKPTMNHICTIDLDTNFEFSCQGDSGAPVMFSYRNQWQQEGIVSYGKLCGIGSPDVNVKVVNYVDWIKNNLKP